MKNNSWNYKPGDLIKIWYHGFEPEIGIITKFYKNPAGRKCWSYARTDGQQCYFAETRMEEDITIKVMATGA